jgi:hypothetical protein
MQEKEAHAECGNGVAVGPEMRVPAGCMPAILPLFPGTASGTEAAPWRLLGRSVRCGGKGGF